MRLLVLEVKVSYKMGSGELRCWTIGLGKNGGGRMVVIGE